MYRDLLDVKIAVNGVGDEVTDRRVGGVGGEPRTASLVVAGEYVERQRFILGYLRHADIAKTFSSRTLDVLQDGELSLMNRSDLHRGMVPPSCCRQPPLFRACASVGRVSRSGLRSVTANNQSNDQRLLQPGPMKPLGPP